MDKLRIKNFRCFKDTGEINLAPITFLVGENSSGKTSFLAGYRYVHNFLRGEPEVSFNTRPFNLGSPEQILRRGAEEISFQTKWKIKEHDSAQGARRRDGNFEKERTSEEAASVGIDASLSTVDGGLSAISLDATIPSGRLRAKRDNTGNNKRVRLSYSPQTESTTGFSRVMIDEISVSGMDYGLWKVSRFHNMEGSKSDNKAISVKEERVKVREVAKLRHELRDVILSKRGERLFTFAPMRTKPSRVYEQKDIVSRSDEGEHMARLLYDLLVRASQTTHAKFFETELAKWGEESGLFSELQIHQFGEQSFDPYQILVVPKKNAPPDNLVDVGYGVSQVLPIVSDILDSESSHRPVYRPVTFLIQQPEVHLHPRAQAALTSFFYRIHQKTGARFLIETHSDYLLDRASIEIQKACKSNSEKSRGAKPQDIFTMLYFEQNAARTESKIHQLNFDENGDVLDVPKNYRRFFLEERKRHLGI